MCLAVPGKILGVSGEAPLGRIARVAFGPVVREVNLAYVPEAVVGDYVIVHVGFAISRLDEKAAAETLKLVDELGRNP
jgi:hydrogenase expression/formation protein HypC